MGVTTTQVQQAAARLGTRAGERFRDTGLPQRCPFPVESVPGAAWRRAYFAVIANARARAR